MKRIKKGSIVARKSYNNDILFIVDKIISTNNSRVALLTGLIERITADSPIEDLELIDKSVAKENLKKLDYKINERFKTLLSSNNIDNAGKNKRMNEKIITGKILHLDGDKKYSEKSYYYYKKVGLNAVVKNIPEYKQPKVVYNLLKIYNPDILVITGHDGMIKKNIGYNDLYNYRNSRHFVKTVEEARRYDLETGKNLVIFAGACQSYFEALMMAGANFASSPARILIDFLDPLIIAETVALTDIYKFVSIDDIVNELRDGKKGVDGIGAKGKMIRKITL